MLKRILSFTIVLIMLFALEAPAFAAEVSEAPVTETAQAETTAAAVQEEERNVQSKGTYNNLKYEIADGEVTITGYTTKPIGTLTIPETIDGYPVTAIKSAFTPNDGAFYYCTALTSVEMPSVQTIGSSAFGFCTALTSVEMPSVQTIGSSAFSRCTSLTSVDMPSVQTIGSYAFDSCTSLTSVEMPRVQRIGDNAFWSCSSLTSLEMPNVKEVAGNSFYATPWYSNLSAEFNVFGDGVLVKYNGSAATVTIPDNVKYVAGFYLNTSVKTVNMSKAQTVGNYAFRDCTALTSVEMPNVQTIGDWTFEGCSSLKSVEMPSVQTIGSYAFGSCGSLKSVEMPSVQTIGSYAFGFCGSLTSVEMPNVKEVAGNSFDDTPWYRNLSAEFNVFGDGVLVKYNGSAATVTIPDNVKCVAGFSSDHSPNYPVKTVKMSKAQTVGDYAFYSCVALRTVEMPSVLSIGSYAFSADPSSDPMKITSVSMPSVQTIGSYAFYRCKSLTSVEMPSVQTIGSYAFYRCTALTSVEMPNVQSIGRSAFSDCSALTSVEMPSVQTIGSYAFRYCTSLTSVEMPSVHMIGSDAFYSCSSLTSVEMPSVQTIGSDAFYNCTSLTSVEMPSVPTIGSYAFYRCTALTSVEMPNVQTIGGSAFYCCTALTSVEMPRVQRIGDNAFRSCSSLTSVEMPSVLSIGNDAFRYCSSLVSAYFYSDAPTSFGYMVFSSCADDFTIYYAKGTMGWTSPTWNGYPTQEFVTEGYKNVVFTDSLTNEVIGTRFVKAGTSATAPTPPAHTGYTFVRWDKDFSNVTEDMTVTAIYEINKYTVTFVDGFNNNTISTQTVEHGSDAVLPTPPVHTGYTSTGWTSDGKNITADTTITAQYVINKYTVTFIDGTDDTTIYTQIVEHGSAATAPTPPTHTGYTFVRWDKDFSNVTEDMTVTAIYKINEYTVIFVDGLNGNTLSGQTVQHGQSATAPEPPVHVGYTFAGWDKDFTNVTQDMTVTARYDVSKYTVTFIDGYNNDVILTATVDYGKDAVMPSAPTHTGYNFIGWDKDGKFITEDTTITALYEVQKFTVTFKDGVTDTVIFTQEVEYGKDATLPTPPTHEGYNFIGWSSNGVYITSDTVITANYKVITFTVKFVDSITGNTLSTQEVEYGKDVIFPAPPEHTGYTFTGWDCDGKNITADTTITALYEQSYKLGDINGDGKLNTGDAVLVLRKCVGLVEFNENQAKAADIDGDGKITTGDAVRILRIAVGLYEEPEN